MILTFFPFFLFPFKQEFKSVNKLPFPTFDPLNVLMNIQIKDGICLLIVKVIVKELVWCGTLLGSLVVQIGSPIKSSAE